MKLIRLIVTTMSKMVSVRLRSGSSENTPPLGIGSQGSDWPLQTRMPAAATCPASLLIALSPHRSSMNPTPTRAPARRPLPGQLADRDESPPVVDEPDHDHERAGQQQSGRGLRPGGLEGILQRGQPAGHDQPRAEP